MIGQKNIKINSNLYNFVNTEVLSGLNISSEDFWSGFSDIVDIYYMLNISCFTDISLIRFLCCPVKFILDAPVPLVAK